MTYLEISCLPQALAVCQGRAVLILGAVQHCPSVGTEAAADPPSPARGGAVSSWFLTDACSRFADGGGGGWTCCFQTSECLETK